MDAVNSIAQDDVISTVTIIREGASAKAFDAPKVFKVAQQELEKINIEKAKQAAEEMKNLTKGATTTASGLSYKVINKGDGSVHPAANSTVKVHYTGKLVDGTIFDSSVQRGQPVEFPLNRVIPGWTEGVQLMVVGDKWTFIIPGNLAYGDRGIPQAGIGPNATLIFEVELLDILEAGDEPHKGHNHQIENKKPMGSYCKVVFYLGDLLNIDVVIAGFDFCAFWEIDYLAREDSMI